MIKAQSKKTQKKTFIVGDVHGCFNEFLTLLKKIDYNKKKHRLILVGDIINRGPYSYEMLKWVKKNNVEMVRGNHEQAFITGVEQNRLVHPILKTLKKDMKSSLKNWMKWLCSLPFYIEEKDFLVVHAGLVPQEEPLFSDPHHLMNIRTWDGVGDDIKSSFYPAWHEVYTKNKLVVYGHWAYQGLKVKNNSIGLDTGCVYGKKLTGILLPERKIIQIASFKNYCSFT